MGRVEQRLYRQQMARRRLGRMIVLTLLIFAAGALTLTRNAASHLTAETIAQPTATPIAAAAVTPRIQVKYHIAVSPCASSDPHGTRIEKRMRDKQDLGVPV